MKRAFSIVLALVLALAIAVVLGIIAFQVLHEPVRAGSPVPAVDSAQQVEHGAYLARAGNCMACHTARGGAAYAGGRAIRTPFGDIYASNITPDTQTGIGNWSADDFWRALHHGKSKDGRFLYPAFPYPDYTKVTRADADALYAYLRTLEPVHQQNLEPELRFPYNQRLLLAFWRTLYFRPGTYQEQPQQSAEWNRGAYLVQGLGHCSACHTGRTALGGPLGAERLAGGTIPMLDWHAASLTADPATGIGDWESSDLAVFLSTGVSERSAASGPMAEVVAGSLQHLSRSDIDAIAHYLKTVPAVVRSHAPSSIPAGRDVDALLRNGARIYEQHCVACHQADGRGAPPAYPPLAGNRALSNQPPTNAIRLVLNGGYPPSTNGNPRPYGMPAFAVVLSDSEVAAVVSYVRASWGNKGAPVSPVDVARLRGAPLE